MGIANDSENFEYALYLIRYKVKRLIGLFGYTEHDRDDLEQDLTVHLITKWSQFDSRRGAAKTFINRVLENKISHIVEAKKAQKRTSELFTVSLNAPLVEGEECSSERIDCMDQEQYLLRTGLKRMSEEELADMRVDIARVLERLPEELRELCERLRVSTVSEIAQEMGISRQKLYESIHKLRELFSDAGLTDYL